MSDFVAVKNIWGRREARSKEGAGSKPKPDPKWRLGQGIHISDLDETTLSLCVSFLDVEEVLLRVALVSKQFNAVASSEWVWGTLFLRKFGHDYWGENVGRHPYIVCSSPSQSLDVSFLLISSFCMLHFLHLFIFPPPPTYPHFGLCRSLSDFCLLKEK